MTKCLPTIWLYQCCRKQNGNSFYLECTQICSICLDRFYDIQRPSISRFYTNIYVTLDMFFCVQTSKSLVILFPLLALSIWNMAYTHLHLSFNNSSCYPPYEFNVILPWTVNNNCYVQIFKGRLFLMTRECLRGNYSSLKSVTLNDDFI